MANPSPYGLHRVIEPVGLLPQPAWRLDNRLPLAANELLISVSRLNVDAASFTEMRQAAGDDTAAIADRIREIVDERGKLHNPVTGSGGMLVGTVAAIGPDFPDQSLRVGDRIATLVSLSLTPLHLDTIGAVHLETDQVDVTGHAIIFATGLYARLPDDLDEHLVLALLDVAGAPAQTARLVQSGDTVVVLGGGGKSGTLCLYQAREKAGPTGCVIGIAPYQADIDRMQATGWVDHILEVDARDAVAVMTAVAEVTHGAMADVVINCVNIPDTEMAAILAAKQGGKVYFFSMATRFTAAALGAEGVGKDVELLIGNGYASGHAALAIACLRDSPRLRALFENYYISPKGATKGAVAA